MGAWPGTVTFRHPDLGRVLFCHGTPWSETDGFTHLTAEESLRPVFEGVAADVVVCGHTHMQFDRVVGATRVVNAGSVGQPFGEPGANWLLPAEEMAAAFANLSFSSNAPRWPPPNKRLPPTAAAAILNRRG